ncbi:MAG: Octaprenyl diphosphate synthase [Candidatus Carbobacillus altaicus]|uniref:Farnesyl diphosphate synthase n=1 Tax=Candidatus Carbonibacillus altaicus TaxID=2163959 RepID=A0A2R6Y386_9BACL|nr:MAG: Octaprenyl diphosphate synthase [Candidatus Carbobacillus altaicus]
MMQDIRAYMRLVQEETERALRRYLPKHAPDTLQEAIAYSLFAGGKRLRPLFHFATLEALGAERSIGYPVVAALEMVHTYSLIHDDLPAMDNDDLRRGKPTNHKVFGEAVAILAGDALQAQAFFALSDLLSFPGLPPAKLLVLFQGFARAIGAEGMVGGQVLDLEAEGKNIELDALEHLHRLKTGSLIVFSVESAAILGGAKAKEHEALVRYARALGLAFQVQDDILDVIGDEKMLGKKTRQDDIQQKSTYPALIGLEEAQKFRDRLIEEAKQALDVLTEERQSIQILFAIADLVGTRES